MGEGQGEGALILLSQAGVDMVEARHFPGAEPVPATATKDSGAKFLGLPSEPVGDSISVSPEFPAM